MDVKAYLISQGSDAETAEAISSNPKFAAIYEKAATEAENGKTAYQKALEVEATMKKWNQNEVIPYVQKADAAVAKSNAELAKVREYLKTQKAQGYEIPDAWLDDGSGGTPNVTPPVSTTPQKDYDDLIQKGQLAQMELIDLANEAFDLTGKRIRVNDEYKQFATEARPGENLRSYVTRKYDLENIRTTKAKETEQKKLDDYAAVRVAAEKAEWAKSHGTNGETRIPQNSKFAEIAAQRKESGGEKLWQTKEGRAQADQRRLEKYSQIM